MKNTYRVAVHFNDTLGYVEYIATTKTIHVVLADAAMKAKAEEYFATAQEISIPHETLHDFTKQRIVPSNSLEEFKLALTRVWGSIQLYVDWSRPVDIVTADM